VATLWVVEWKFRRKGKWLVILQATYSSKTKANEAAKEWDARYGDNCEYRVAKYVRAEEG
jgi:hypothetical protein